MRGSEDVVALRGRLWVAALVAGGVALLLVLRWVSLQVGQFSHFSELAHENQVKLLPIEPSRGLIFDRHGEQLAGNSPIFSIRVASDFADEVLGRMDTLTAVVDIPPKALQMLREAERSRVYSGNIVLREKLTEAEISRFLSWQFLFPEIIFDASLARVYPHGDAGGHVLGFVGRINPDDVTRLRQLNRSADYNGATFIGKTGAELVNEDALRGRLGSQEAQVDAHGRILRSRLIVPPVPGEDLYLTIDWRLQRLAESLLAGERGAAVMMDVHSGELLALASNPRFDVNKFVFGISQEDWDALNQSDDKPLVHRAIYGQYAPGSTIKPFLALAALERGWRDWDYVYHSQGFFQLSPKHVFHDWKRGGHGQVDITKSIVRSVNSFYYQLGYEVGIDKIYDALQVFGFGEKTRVDLDNEKGGVLPSVDWKKARLDEPWYPGDTIAASVGQGYMQVTPLQLARAMAVVANGGRRVTPYLVRPAAEAVSVRFSARALRVVREALEAVTQPGGTAARMGRGAVFGIAGKTGTAQVSRLQLDEDGERVKNKDLPKHLRDHAWFVGYAPSEAPRVAVAVIVENSGSGGVVAGPVVRALLDAYMGVEAVEEVVEEVAAEVVEVEGGEEAVGEDVPAAGGGEA